MKNGFEICGIMPVVVARRRVENKLRKNANKQTCKQKNWTRVHFVLQLHFCECTLR